MTTSHAHHPDPVSSARTLRDNHGEQPVLLVGVCTGHRCAALRRIGNGDPQHTDPIESGANHSGANIDAADAGHDSLCDSERLIRQAIRDRRDAVLVSLPCLGPCAQGSVAALGAALAGHNALTWLGRPAMFGLTQIPERSRALADWIGAGAPDPQTMPAPLRRGLDDLLSG